MSLRSFIEATFGGVFGFVLMMLSLRYWRPTMYFSEKIVTCSELGCITSYFVTFLLSIAFYIALYFLIKRFSQNAAVAYVIFLLSTLILVLGYFLYLGLVVRLFEDSVYATKVEEPMLWRFLVGWIK